MSRTSKEDDAALTPVSPYHLLRNKMHLVGENRIAVLQGTTPSVSYAISYVQERGANGTWIFSAALRRTFEYMASVKVGVWLDRLAKPWGIAGKQWAVEGLRPYSRYRTLSVAPTIPLQKASVAYSNLFTRTEGDWQAVAEKLSRMAPYEAFCESLEISACVGYVDIEAFARSLKAINAVRSTRITKFLKEMIHEASRIDQGDKEVVHVLNPAHFRCWPFSERITASRAKGIWILPWDVIPLQQSLKHLLATYAFLALSWRGRGDLHVLRLIRSALCSFSGVRNLDTGLCVTNGEYWLWKEVKEAGIPVGESIEVDLAVTFWAAPIYSQMDKVSLVFASERMNSITEKFDWIINRGIFGITEDSKFLKARPLHLASTGTLTAATMSFSQSQDCPQLLSTYPGLTNSLLCEWFDGRGVQADISGLASWGWSRVGWVIVPLGSRKISSKNVFSSSSDFTAEIMDPVPVPSVILEALVRTTRASREECREVCFSVPGAGSMDKVVARGYIIGRKEKHLVAIEGEVATPILSPRVAPHAMPLGSKNFLRALPRRFVSIKSLARTTLKKLMLLLPAPECLQERPNLSDFLSFQDIDLISVVYSGWSVGGFLGFGGFIVVDSRSQRRHRDIVTRRESKMNRRTRRIGKRHKRLRNR